FAWSSHLDRHMRTHVTTRDTTRVTTVTAGDEEGVQAAQEPPPALQRCADCGKGLSQQTAPRRFEHKATQTPLGGTGPAPRPHGRKRRGKCCSSSSGLLTHRHKHPQPCPERPRRFGCGTAQPGQPQACPECGKGFSSPAGLQRHRRLHRGKKPYQCGLCGKGFS
ncbi:ZSC21 protein, partial [Copsychus sechellarum]|nr:ZSC21 protein [Copsychus sechellarum]